MAAVEHPIGARVRFPLGIPMLVVDLDIERDIRVCAWRTSQGHARERQFRTSSLLAAGAPGRR